MIDFIIGDIQHILAEIAFFIIGIYLQFLSFQDRPAAGFASGHS